MDEGMWWGMCDVALMLSLDLSAIKQSLEADGFYPFEFIQEMPKTDLHVHLDGSLRFDDDRDTC